MKRSLTRTIGTISFALGFLLYPPMIHGQASGDDRRPSIAGRVCDAQNRPLAGVKVSLDSAELGAPITATTDSLGHFEFSQLAAGTYTLHARLPGVPGAAEGPFALNAHERKSFLLRLQTASSTESSKDSSADIPFSDETHFTVAGVTDSSSLGGHGSGIAMYSRKIPPFYRARVPVLPAKPPSVPSSARRITPNCVFSLHRWKRTPAVRSMR
jgi:hypothetical protein